MLCKPNWLDCCCTPLACRFSSHCLSDCRACCIQVHCARYWIVLRLLSSCFPLLFFCLAIAFGLCSGSSRVCEVLALGLPSSRSRIAAPPLSIANNRHVPRWSGRRPLGVPGRATAARGSRAILAGDLNSTMKSRAEKRFREGFHENQGLVGRPGVHMSLRKKDMTAACQWRLT